MVDDEEFAEDVDAARRILAEQHAQPTRLSPEMLSDDLRDGVLALKSITEKQRTNWEIMLRSSAGQNARLRANIAQADMAIATADRLLGDS